MGREFAALVLTHGRPNNVKTVGALRRHGYTGKIFLVVDDEDKALPEYQQNFGTDIVKVFSKKEVAETMDEMELSPDRRTVVYARNACQGIAEKEGLTHYVQLDDDYQWFEHRRVENSRLMSYKAYHLDDVFAAFCDFLDSTPTLTIAMAQGGDFIGGAGNSFWYYGIRRKAMNSFFCRADRPFKFIGRINEDVNTYAKLGNLGGLFFTATNFSLVQQETQQNSGGMTDTYLQGGTYMKSFPTVMLLPSAAKVREMSTSKGVSRLHHVINWQRAVPKIIAEKHRKSEAGK